MIHVKFAMFVAFRKRTFFVFLKFRRDNQTQHRIQKDLELARYQLLEVFVTCTFVKDSSNTMLIITRHIVWNCQRKQMKVFSILVRWQNAPTLRTTPVTHESTDWSPGRNPTPRYHSPSTPQVSARIKLQQICVVSISEFYGKVKLRSVYEL